MATLADLLTSRIPPHSLEAERAVLGGLMLEAEAVVPMLERLVADDFYKEGHRTIFAAMLSCVGSGQEIDLLTVTDRLRREDQLEEVGGAAVLSQLVEEAGTLYRLDSYAAIVREKATLRNLIRLGTDVIGSVYSNGQPAADLLAKTSRDLEGLARRAAPTATAFPAMTIGELARSDIPEPTFHVPGWIPATGVTFIVGDSEAYKSWFSLLLAVCVAAGQPLFGKFPVVQAPTLVISEENGLAEDRRRIHLICRGLGLDPESVPCHIASDSGFSFDDTVKAAALRAYIEAHKIKLIFIDSFVRVHRRKENDAGEMSALYLDRMKPIIQSGVALAFLHHRRKVQQGPQQPQGGNGDGDDIRGSGDIRAATHSVLFLRKVSETQVLVKHNKTRGFKRQEPYVFSITDEADGIVFTWEGKPEAILDKSDACREAILVYAAEKGSFWRKDFEATFKGQYGKKVFDPLLKALSANGTPLRRELRGPHNAAWYVYVPQALDTTTPTESDDAELPF